MLSYLSPVLFISVIFTSLLSAGGYTLDDFNRVIEDLEADSAVVPVCREFIDAAQDMETIRTAQNRWKRIDAEAAVAHARKAYDTHPDSARFVYMYGRLLDDPLEQIRLGKRTIELAPDWVYGYRLVFAPYVLSLFDRRGSAEERTALAGSLSEDEHLLRRFYEFEGDNDISLRFMFSLVKYQKDYPAALEFLEKAEQAEAAWVNDLEFARIHNSLKDYDQTLNSVSDHVDQKITDGDYKPSERQDKIDQIYTNLLRINQEYERIEAHLKSVSNWQENPRTLYHLARYAAVQERRDDAFDFLFRAADNGWGYVENTSKSRDLKPLQDDDRWSELVQKMELAWERGSDERRAETLDSKTMKEAFNWVLTNLEGDTLRLSDLAGNIIILDFWASWCGPCKAAMPVLDTWCRTEKPENVRVFSVNIWERDVELAKSIMKDNEYAMEFLFGNDKLAEHYGFNSIPFICVVDNTGKLRYEQIGYSQELEEKLSWWVQDLQN